MYVHEHGHGYLFLCAQVVIGQLFLLHFGHREVRGFMGGHVEKLAHIRRCAFAAARPHTRHSTQRPPPLWLRGVLEQPLLRLGWSMGCSIHGGHAICDGTIEFLDGRLELFLSRLLLLFVYRFVYK